MTKPGYGTIVEAIALQLPVLYVRRYNFDEQSPSSTICIDTDAASNYHWINFAQGRWEASLATIVGHTVAFVATATNRWNRGSSLYLAATSEPSARTTPTTLDSKEFRPLRLLWLSLIAILIPSGDRVAGLVFRVQQLPHPESSQYCCRRRRVIEALIRNHYDRQLPGRGSQAQLTEDLLH